MAGVATARAAISGRTNFFMLLLLKQVYAPVFL
jgi:hypothetical protein